MAEPVIQKMWTILGTIRDMDIARCYYLDPGMQGESTRCLDAVSTGEFALLWGARASGKRTRLFWLRNKLIAMGYQALYLSFGSIQYNDNIGKFWRSFSESATADAAGAFGPPQGSSTKVSSRDEFLELFWADSWRQNVVLLIDGLHQLCRAQPYIRDEFLRAFREIRNNNEMYAIRSVIAAGTLDIVNLKPSDSTFSPFTSHIQHPHFTVEEVRKLFYEFAQDRHITIDDAVVEDIWAQSNGHPAMVCLCGRTVCEYLSSLLDSDSENVSYRNWQQFLTNNVNLYDEIQAYDTFGFILRSFARPEAAAAVTLLRSCFVGFLDEVELKDDVERDLADSMVSIGALLKPDSVRPYYRMASPLLDGLIRCRLIPNKFPDSPSSVLPYEDGQFLFLGILIESLKFFDKALIRLAASRSYKTSKVEIPGVPDGHVPRESVYDMELMRILSNWLQRIGSWRVTPQWHLQTHMKNKHKYSDIVIKDSDNPTIVLELVATGDTSLVRSHIQKAPECMALLSADEAWVVHFTCEPDYHPIWQSDVELSGGVNVVHFAHDLDFTNVVMSARWKDRAGNTQHEDRRLLTV